MHINRITSRYTRLLDKAINNKLMIIVEYIRSGLLLVIDSINDCLML
jgi:hypothetical protein